MEEDEPSCRVLAKFSQPFHSSGNEHVCIQPSKAVKVFERDIRTNEFQLIRWNNYDRGAKTDWTIESEELWYNAARRWNEIITYPEMEIWLQLQPGTTISIYALSSSKSNRSTDLEMQFLIIGGCFMAVLHFQDNEGCVVAIVCFLFLFSLPFSPFVSSQIYQLGD